MYAYGFRFYFTPLPGFFSPFPHGTGSLSVGREYLALEDGPPMFKQDFTCPVLLAITQLIFRVPGCHRLWPAVPGRSARSHCASGLLPVRSPLLGESRLISFPPVTEMFQFTGFASVALYIQARMTPKGRVSPFGHPRIKACLPAPRGLSQATTSFIAFCRLGIHRMHLVT